MTKEEAEATCEKHGWGWIFHPMGLWIVGPETSDGIVEAWGQGVKFEDAVEKAKRR